MSKPSNSSKNNGRISNEEKKRMRQQYGVAQPKEENDMNKNDTLPTPEEVAAAINGTIVKGPVTTTKEDGTQETKYPATDVVFTITRVLLPGAPAWKVTEDNLFATKTERMPDPNDSTSYTLVAKVCPNFQVFIVDVEGNKGILNLSNTLYGKTVYDKETEKMKPLLDHNKQQVQTSFLFEFIKDVRHQTLGKFFSIGAAQYTFDKAKEHLAELLRNGNSIEGRKQKVESWFPATEDRKASDKPYITYRYFPNYSVKKVVTKAEEEAPADHAADNSAEYELR